MRGVGLLVLMLSCGVVSLAEDVIPTSIPQKCFYFDTGTNTITGYKFSDPDCPRDVVIPNEITVTGEVYEVKELGKNSFSHTNYTGYLHSVVMPTTLKKIGEQAFAGQHNIHTIKFFEDKIYESYQEIKRSRCIHIGDLAEGFFTIQNLKSYDNIILLDVICDDIDDLNRFIIKLPEIEKNKDYVFMLKFDGDYLDFYIDDVFIHTFCKINEATLKEYENLIKNNTCDLSKVTWPRHADGTCDYDSSKKY